MKLPSVVFEKILNFISVKDFENITQAVQYEPELKHTIEKLCSNGGDKAVYYCPICLDENGSLDRINKIFEDPTLMIPTLGFGAGKLQQQIVSHRYVDDSLRLKGLPIKSLERCRDLETNGYVKNISRKYRRFLLSKLTMKNKIGCVL